MSAGVFMVDQTSKAWAIRRLRRSDCEVKLSMRTARIALRQLPAVAGRGGFVVGRFKGRFFAAAIASTVTALVVGGIAFAQIPATDGTITACYNKSGGALTVIDASIANCGKTQTQLQWNQKGVAGATGAPGANGSNGSPGAPGASGFVSVTPLVQIPFPTTLTSSFQMLDAPGTTVTVAAGQKLMIDLSVPLRSNAGANGFMFLCDDAIPGFEPLSSERNFIVSASGTNGNAFDFQTLSGASTGIVGSATPGFLPISAGTYHVGVCANGSGLVDGGLTNETGFVTVVNSP